jgi:8-oxo-dGTP pyrophosphatase MutT (NUDIX family)
MAERLGHVGLAPTYVPVSTYFDTVRTGAEVAVFVTRRRGRDVLVVHRVPEQGGYWHVVAGGVEPGETAVQAAERELREETGLVADVRPGVDVIGCVYPLSEEPANRRAQYDPSVVAIRVECFRAEAPPDWEPTLNWEHDDHRWCSPAKAFDVLRWPATAEALRRMLGT